jgi:hypothetical protein
MRRIKTLAAALGAIGLAAAMTLAGAGTARANVTPPSGTWFEIFNRYLHAQNITLCVDDPNASTDVTKLRLWRCHGYASDGAAQRWFFTPTGTYNNDNGTIYTTYQIKDGASNLCLGFPETFPTGVDLIQERCGAGAFDTDWVLEPIDPSATGTNPDFVLETLEPRLSYVGHWCIAASTFNDTNGTRLLAEPCSPTDSRQLWNL